MADLDELLSVDELKERIRSLGAEIVSIQSRLRVRFEDSNFRSRAGWQINRDKLKAQIPPICTEIQRLKEVRREALRAAHAVKASVTDPDDAFSLLQAAMRTIRAMAFRLNYELTEDEQRTRDLITMFFNKHAPVESSTTTDDDWDDDGDDD